MNKNLVIFSSVIFFLLSANLTAAFMIYVQPANQGVVRLNVTQFMTATAKRSFEIRNPNNFSISVDLEPDANLTKFVDIEKTFSLQPNESRIVNYTIKVSEPGTYYGNILIDFKSSDSVVSYQTSLAIVARKSNFNYLTFVIPAAVIVVAILIVLLKGRWKISVRKKVTR
jgi:hypothetical protein